MSLEVGLTIISLIGIGVTIGMIRSKYLTKEEHDRLSKDCVASMQREFQELQENRREVWAKIDQIYEWMITGVVQINRKD